MHANEAQLCFLSVFVDVRSPASVELDDKDLIHTLRSEADRVVHWRKDDFLRHEHGDEFPEGAPAQRDEVLYLSGEYFDYAFKCTSVSVVH